MSGDERYVLEGFAVPEELGRVHDLLGRVSADHPEVDPTDLMLFETAVMEIAGNVVEHGLPPGEVRWRLAVRVTGEQIEADLRDTGHEFSADFGKPMPGVDAESGRGLPLASAVLDQLELARVDEGNHWRLARHLRP